MNEVHRRQLLGVLKWELGRALLGRRGIPVVLLALAPVLMAGLFALGRSRGFLNVRMDELQPVWAGLFHGLILRTLVFFGSMWVFVNLIRGELVDRTLHLTLLLPVPRSILLAGKFLGAWIATGLLFGVATAASWLLLFAGTNSPPPTQLVSWVGIVALGCLGYGAIFAVLGMFLRNPIFAAIGLWGWDWIEIILPGPLKKLTVAHYLKRLSPIPIDEGPLAVVGTTTAAPLAIGGLLLFVAALLALGTVRLRRLEIDYGGD
jgi:hypothetical protein